MFSLAPDKALKTEKWSVCCVQSSLWGRLNIAPIVNLVLPFRLKGLNVSAYTSKQIT